MSDATGSVTDEDVVVQAILEGSGEQLKEFLRTRPSFAPLVREVQSVADGLRSIEDAPPPSFPIEHIIRKNDRPLFAWLQDLPLQWYKNPYILSFSFVLAIIFFYFFIVYLLGF